MSNKIEIRTYTVTVEITGEHPSPEDVALTMQHAAEIISANRALPDYFIHIKRVPLLANIKMVKEVF